MAIWPNWTEYQTSQQAFGNIPEESFNDAQTYLYLRHACKSGVFYPALRGPRMLRKCFSTPSLCRQRCTDTNIVRYVDRLSSRFTFLYKGLLMAAKVADADSMCVAIPDLHVELIPDHSLIMILAGRGIILSLSRWMLGAPHIPCSDCAGVCPQRSNRPSS